MSRFLLLLCTLCVWLRFINVTTAEEIVHEDDNEFQPHFFCGIIDDYNVIYSRLVRVNPKLDIVIDSNRIRNIARSVFKNCADTRSLTMVNTRLNTLTGQRLEGLRNVRMLSFFNGVIDNVTDGTFDGSPFLEELELSYNRLNGLGTGVRNGLKELQKLHLNHNPILLMKDGFTGLPKLELLELTGANISDIPSGSFNGLANLQRLDLSSNELTNVAESSFRELIKLEELDLSINQITTISKNTFEGLTNLNYLWLNDNRISSLKTLNVFEWIQNLKELYLHENPLQFLDVAVFKNLRKAVIEPGFVVDVSGKAKKNFASVSSTQLYHCSPLYGSVESGNQTTNGFSETLENASITVNVRPEGNNLDYFKPLYCVAMSESEPRVDRL